PIAGKGLWSTLYGYFAVEPDGRTVKGITFYKHGETPGLGGEIEKDWFQKNFIGKQFVNEKNELLGIQIIKGKVQSDDKEAYHKVDGISGATMTGKGLEYFLKDDLSKYEPFFKQIRGEHG
ncbi:MAG: NADH:ubiquinone reductase (Na(+)-transporting) subunit C, partial [Candidatus Marinimicrobia bacterium]|nr:NADH:ubiquinone reductase (Na(+)-transporting) subunit C [Candidatus Neomarinimicrobiota bacterium]